MIYSAVHAVLFTVISISQYIIVCYSSGIDIPVCEPDLDRCPEVNRIVPVMLGIYILFTQILMFNLLIAMFRSVIHV